MMKKWISYMLLAVPLAGMCQQQKFNVKGTITGVSPKAKMYLSYIEGSAAITDSCRVKNGTFQFSGILKEPRSAVLVLGHDGKFDDYGKPDMQSVYLENGTVQVEGKDSVAKARIWGTPLNADNQERLSLLKSMKRSTEEPKLIAAFVEKHPASWVSLNWLADKGAKSPLLAESYTKLSPALKNTATGKELGLAIRNYLATRPGQPAPDFSLPNPEGKMIRLSDLRGKYVFLDFWSSSCKPCRAAHPKYKALYETLHKTGRFEILAVSMDRLKAPWVKAIAEDQVPWLHVADLHPKRRNIAAELYGVGILPYGFLIDPNGIILPDAIKTEFFRTKVLPDEKKKIKPAGLTGSLSGLSENSMRAQLEMEKLDTAGFKEEFGKLYRILESDIGEGALAEELGKLKFPDDSLAIRRLLAAKGIALHIKKERMRQAFIAENPNSFVSLVQLEGLENMYTADGYMAAFASLSERLKQTHMGKTIQARFGKFKSSPTGTIAPDFIRNDQYGRRIRLSDYRGKLVLLDFWASWCVPCRQTHPHLKELYARYKSKGLEIVAVANEKKAADLEKAKQGWLAAIKKDGVNWVHVLNEDGTDIQDIVKDYGITTFPTKLLLDKDGRILMRQTGGANDEMDKLIAKMLD